MTFAPLRVHSHHSLLWGTASPRRLVEAAADLGCKTLALTDRDSVAGLVEFLDAAEEHGVRALVGAEITGEHPMLLLARDSSGYESMCRVVTDRKTAAVFDPASSLAEAPGGVHVVCGRPDTARALADVVERGSLWVDLPARGRRGIAPVALRRAAVQLGVGLVATGRVSLGSCADAGAHAVLRASAEGRLVGDSPLAGYAQGADVLGRPESMGRGWEDAPDALLANRRVADSCSVELRRGTPVFPRAPMPRGITAGEHLRSRCLEGLRSRGAAPNGEVLRRLNHELDVIGRLGFADYFVIVGDIVRAARASGIPTVGRGSGAGSLVSWALGITNVNPLRYGLMFERFLHEGRADCPDLDIDLCWKGRDRVIDHVYRTYGRDRVAMISTHVLFHPRSAFREAARAHGVPVARVNRLSRLLPSAWEDGGVARAVRADPALARAFGAEDPQMAKVLEVADALEGLPRHLGIHSGGIVIGDRPLVAYTGMERASKGIIVTQYEMRSIERVGLVKIDLLGNRALSTLRETAAFVERSRGVRVDLDRVPDGHAGAVRLLGAGETLGAFQIESPGVRNLLRQLQPVDLDGVIAALSLIRPGPAGSGMKDLYIARAHGETPVTWHDGRLRAVLAESHGILLYEEDVIRVASVIAGISPGDADGLRRAIARAESDPERDSLGRWFVERAVRNGTDLAAARAVWKELARFGAYAFCKAHAAGYGVLAYLSVVMKADYPVEFTAALLNHHQGMYPLRVHVEEARRRGVRILGPCVQHSQAGATVEDGSVRLGISGVAGVSDRTVHAVVSIGERSAERRYTGMADLLRRARPSFPEASALVRCGACDAFGENRSVLAWRLRASSGRRTKRPSPTAPGLFDAACPVLPDRAPDLPAPDVRERAAAETELLGFPLEAHALAACARELRQEGVTAAARLAGRAGRRARVAGIPATRRTVAARGGRRMLFLTLEDDTGLVECTLFPDVYRRHRELARSGRAVVASGRVEDRRGALTLVVDGLRALEQADRPQVTEESSQNARSSERSYPG